MHRVRHEDRQVTPEEGWAGTGIRETRGARGTPVSQVSDDDQTEPVTTSLPLAALPRDAAPVGSLLFTYSPRLFTCQ